jgi:DinB superfamily
MQPTYRADISALESAFDDAERDSRALVTGLTNEAAAWRQDADSWSVSECLDHLAIANRVYLGAMKPVAERALTQGRRRRGPAQPGVIGGWFVHTLEPPVRPRFRSKAPRTIRPRPAPSLDDSFEQFLTSQNEVRGFLQRYADIDLAGVLFPNPFLRGLRFSLATGLHVIAAHERRHLWQAWRVREAARAAVAS